MSSSRFLPPLPTLPGENDGYRYRPPGRSIITVLTDEHLRLQALSAELAEAAGAGGGRGADGPASPAAGGPQADHRAGRGTTDRGPTARVPSAGGPAARPPSAGRPAGRPPSAGRPAEHVPAAAGRACRDLADVMTAAVTRHLSAEEQYLYPAVRALLPDGDRIADAEIAQDTELLRELALLEMARPGTTSFLHLARSVDAKLLRHGQRCARQIFPRLGSLAGEADLIRLGNRIEVAEEAAPTRPHPDTPSSPPWNKVVDPAVGAVDRIRDGLEHRKTFPEDL